MDMRRPGKALFTVLGFLLFAVLLVSGCSQKDSITGTVTNKLTGAPVAGAAVTTSPAIKDLSITTDAKGVFTAKLPPGTFTVTIKKDNFKPFTTAVLVVSGKMATQDAVLEPDKKVAVNAGAAQTAKPGASVTLKSTVEPLDGSSLTSVKWTQTAGPKATIASATGDTTSVTLADDAAYKAEIVKGLKLLDRFEVQAINPHTLLASEVATFKVTAVTSSGTYTGTVNVSADLPFAFSTGLQNVPRGVAVLLNGKKQPSYDWAVAGPEGSKAAVADASARNPHFIPDVVGKYTVTEKKSGAKVEVFAGTWAGVITGQDDKGKPLAADCTPCHDGKTAPDMFTAWKNSGHAEIFTQNINNPDGHWAETCATCHTVGYNTNVDNNGWDEAMKAESWKVPPHGELGLWTSILKQYPKTAKLSNIQCENCHGPNNGNTLHPNKTIDAARVSISSDVCGACHGEPPRHGRFQQWEESGHGNFDLAIRQATVENRGATSAHCGRCHSGQGFLAWSKQADLTKQIQGAKGNATVDELKALGLTKDTVQPVTCVTCHDPHKQGATSGKPNTATVRITGDTKMLPAGFKATNVGSGALCMTCHNTRNGARNDAIPPTSYSAPHTAAQADMLMGQNAYFVSVGQRSPHANVKNTCVTCHMQESPPPAEFSFNRGGTNHAFDASPEVCGSCHTKTLNAKAFEAGTEEKVHELAKAMSDYLLNNIAVQVTIKDYTPHQSGGKEYDVKSAPLAVDKTNIVSVEPTEPHGQIGFIIKFRSPVTFTYSPQGEAPHSMVLNEAEVQLGDITTDGKTPLIPLSDVLVRAGWNYFLIHGDGSEGIHNPAFTMEVIEASIKALK
ncbi:MAG: carboxypeptidase regulatory-like domain-containing protein [Dehalococcoidia bacterium]|nr:carboxypeptidase regulatory-like domain-containing protein [Dehalococcoidia bacterium]